MNILDFPESPIAFLTSGSVIQLATKQDFLPLVKSIPCRLAVTDFVCAHAQSRSPELTEVVRIAMDTNLIQYFPCEGREVILEFTRLHRTGALGKSECASLACASLHKAPLIGEGLLLCAAASTCRPAVDVIDLLTLIAAAA